MPILIYFSTNNKININTTKSFRIQMQKTTKKTNTNIYKNNNERKKKKKMKEK